MRHAVPDGDLAILIDQAVTEKLARLEARRFARTERPRKSVADTDTTPSSRQVPSEVRRAVSERDADQCSYRDDAGHRCGERERLEYHHRHPFGYGGDHSVDNVALLCHPHNDLLAQVDYGHLSRRRNP